MLRARTDSFALLSTLYIDPSPSSSSVETTFGNGLQGNGQSPLCASNNAILGYVIVPEELQQLVTVHFERFNFKEVDRRVNILHY